MKDINWEYFKVDTSLLYVKWIYLMAFSTMAPVNNFIPLFYRYLGFTASSIGIIQSLATIFGLTSPIWGTLTDRFSAHKLAFFVGWAFFILSNFSIYFVSFLPHPIDPNFYNNTRCNAIIPNSTIIEPSQISLILPFCIIVICVSISSLFIQPGLLLIDTAALSALGDQVEHYGKQRLWGSIGFGVGSAITGNIIAHFCNIHMLFYLFIFFAIVLYLSIIRFPINAIPSENQNFWEEIRVIIKWKTLPLFYVVLSLGTGHGVLETIVWLFVKDIGGNEDLIGFALLTMCVSEVFFFFISDIILSKLGNYKSLYFAFFSFCVRFMYYFVMTNPWTIFPFELLHGVIWGVAWSATVAISTEIAPISLTATMQGTFLSYSS